MDKNIKVIIAVLAAVLIISLLPQSSITFNAWHSEDKSECEDKFDYYEDRGDRCVIECFEMTSSIESCIEGYNYDGYRDNIGEWYVFHDDEETCYDYYKEKIIDQPDENDVGLYHCSDVFREAVGDLGISDADDVSITSITPTISGLNVNFNVAWTGGVSPYTIEAEMDGEDYYLEGITGTSHSFNHAYANSGTYSDSICIYDDDDSTDNDCKTATVTVSGGPVTCTSFQYSAWGDCTQWDLRFRTVTASYPSGCSGGNRVTEEYCDYNPGDDNDDNDDDGGDTGECLLTLGDFCVQWWMLLAVAAFFLVIMMGGKKRR